MMIIAVVQKILKLVHPYTQRPFIFANFAASNKCLIWINSQHIDNFIIKDKTITFQLNKT